MSARAFISELGIGSREGRVPVIRAVLTVVATPVGGIAIWAIARLAWAFLDWLAGTDRWLVQVIWRELGSAALGGGAAVALAAQWLRFPALAGGAVVCLGLAMWLATVLGIAFRVWPHTYDFDASDAIYATVATLSPIVFAVGGLAVSVMAVNTERERRKDR